MLQRGKHGFQLNTDKGCKIGADADVFFESGEKTRERDAHGVKSWSELLAAENTLRVRQKSHGGNGCAGFRDYLHAGTQLRRAGSVSNDSRENPLNRLQLRHCRIRSQKRERYGQDECPHDSDLSSIHC